MGYIFLGILLLINYAVFLKVFPLNAANAAICASASTLVMLGILSLVGKNFIEKEIEKKEVEKLTKRIKEMEEEDGHLPLHS